MAREDIDDTLAEDILDNLVAKVLDGNHRVTASRKSTVTTPTTESTAGCTSTSTKSRRRSSQIVSGKVNEHVCFLVPMDNSAVCVCRACSNMWYAYSSDTVSSLHDNRT